MGCTGRGLLLRERQPGRDSADQRLSARAAYRPLRLTSISTASSSYTVDQAVDGKRPAPDSAFGRGRDRTAQSTPDTSASHAGCDRDASRMARKCSGGYAWSRLSWNTRTSGYMRPGQPPAEVVAVEDGPAQARRAGKRQRRAPKTLHQDGRRRLARPRPASSAARGTRIAARRERRRQHRPAVEASRRPGRQPRRKHRRRGEKDERREPEVAKPERCEHDACERFRQRETTRQGQQEQSGDGNVDEERAIGWQVGWPELGDAENLGTDAFSYRYSKSPHPYGLTSSAAALPTAIVSARAASRRVSADGQASSASAKRPISNTPKTHSMWRLLQRATIGIAHQSGRADRRARARWMSHEHAAIPAKETRCGRGITRGSSTKNPRTRIATDGRAADCTRQAEIDEQQRRRHRDRLRAPGSRRRRRHATRHRRSCRTARRCSADGSRGR